MLRGLQLEFDLVQEAQLLIVGVAYRVFLQNDLDGMRTLSEFVVVQSIVCSSSATLQFDET